MFFLTYDIASAPAFYTFENTQVRRSAFYRRPPLPGTARSRTSAMALGNRGYPVVSIPTDANSHTTDFVSDIAIFVLKRDVKLQLTN